MTADREQRPGLAVEAAHPAHARGTVDFDGSSARPEEAHLSSYILDFAIESAPPPSVSGMTPTVRSNWVLLQPSDTSLPPLLPCNCQTLLTAAVDTLRIESLWRSFWNPLRATVPRTKPVANVQREAGVGTRDRPVRRVERADLNHSIAEVRRVLILGP